MESLNRTETIDQPGFGLTCSNAVGINELKLENEVKQWAFKVGSSERGLGKRSRSGSLQGYFNQAGSWYKV
jgi:hypothetical protein